MAIELALSVATGRPWAKRSTSKGYKTQAPRPVVIFAGESYHGVVERVQASIANNFYDSELVGENLIIVSDVYSMGSANGLAAMADEIITLGAEPGLIIIDTFNLAHEGNEDSADDVKRSIRGFRSLAQMFNSAGLLIDHVGHGDKKRPRGSYAKRANSDVMILCERQTTNTVVLSQQKNRDDEKEKYRVAFIGERVEVAPQNQAQEPKTNLAFYPIETPKTQPARSEKGSEVLFHKKAVADIAADILENTPGKDWTDRSLADAITHNELIVQKGETVRKWLRELRENNDSPIRRCFDPVSRKWRHRDSNKPTQETPNRH